MTPEQAEAYFQLRLALINWPNARISSHRDMRCRWTTFYIDIRSPSTRLQSTRAIPDETVRGGYAAAWSRALLAELEDHPGARLVHHNLITLRGGPYDHAVCPAPHHPQIKLAEPPPHTRHPNTPALQIHTYQRHPDHPWEYHHA